MEVIVGKYAGFCGGVINSINKTEAILNEYGSSYCLGELVHNKQVVDNLKGKGLILIDNLSEVAEGSRVIVRAHGIPKEVYELAKHNNIELCDLTCPKVLKIHEEAKKLVLEDYFIVLVAQEIHPEAIGTISFCGSNSVILEDIEQLDKVISLINGSGKKKVAVISQTTFSVKKFDLLVNELKSKLNNFEIFVKNTICSATELRQKEIVELSKNVDAMIIIGGKNSSNTKKLFEISQKECEKSFIIEVLSDLDEDMSIYKTVGVMAGASTPKESIDEVVNYLRSI